MPAQRATTGSRALISDSSRSERFTALSDLVRAHCWSEGLDAPVAWVHWILDLEIAAIAESAGVSTAAAELLVPLEMATSLGQQLVQITRENEAG